MCNLVLQISCRSPKFHVGHVLSEEKAKHFDYAPLQGQDPSLADNPGATHVASRYQLRGLTATCAGVCIWTSRLPTMLPNQVASKTEILVPDHFWYLKWQTSCKIFRYPTWSLTKHTFCKIFRYPIWSLTKRIFCKIFRYPTWSLTRHTFCKIFRYQFGPWQNILFVRFSGTQLGPWQDTLFVRLLGTQLATQKNHKNVKKQVANCFLH